jgi:uncharacterized membrane protein YfcA
MMIPPIGLLAAWAYYRQGNVNIPVALFLCVGFLFGGFLGAQAALHLSNDTLRRVFGAALLLIALRMIFSR